MNKNEVTEKLENENKEKTKNTFLKKVPKFVKIILIIICVIAINIGSMGIGVKLSSIFSTKETSIEFGFKNVGKLVSQEWYGTIMEDSKTDRTFFNLFSIPGTESRQLFSIVIKVPAYIDFEQITYNIKDDSKKIELKIPHVEIDTPSEVKDSMQIYIDSESLFSRINLSEHQEARENLMDKAVQTAKDNGILEKAEENAKTIITNIIKSNDKYKNYEIFYEFK